MGGRSGSGRGARRRGPALGFRPGSRRPGCPRPQQLGLRVGGAGRGGPGHPLRSQPAARPLARRREEGGGGSLDVDDRAARDGKCLIKTQLGRARPTCRRASPRVRAEAGGGPRTDPGYDGLRPLTAARRTPAPSDLGRTPALGGLRPDPGSGQTTGRPWPAPGSRLPTDLGRTLTPERPRSRADRRHTAAARSRPRRARTHPGPGQIPARSRLRADLRPTPARRAGGRGPKAPPEAGACAARGMASAVFEGTSLVNMFVRGCWVNGIRRLIVSRRGDEEEFFEIRTEWSDRSVLYLHRSFADLGRLWQRLRDAFPEDRPELARAPLRQGSGAAGTGVGRGGASDGILGGDVVAR